MQVEIKIQTSSPAFQPAPQLEVARILRSLADKVERAAMLKDCHNMTLRDREGEPAGGMQVTVEPYNRSAEDQAFTSAQEYPSCR